MILYAFFIVLTSLTGAYGQDRKINSTLNLGCNDCANLTTTTLIYTKATGDQDAIHQIWDFSSGIPTIIFAIGSINSTINITWSQRRPEHFILSEQPKYSFAVAIDKLYEYNDVEDYGQIDEKCQQKAISLSDVTWTREYMKLSEKEAKVQVGSKYSEHGGIEFKIDLLPFTDYGTELPHLIHNANSSLLDVSLINLTTSQEFNSSRFALHMLMISTDAVKDTMHYTVRKSLDDEHTPGVFEVVEVLSPRSWQGGAGGWLQSRPVAYTMPQRSVSSSAGVHLSAFNWTWLPEQATTLRNFYDEQDITPLVQDMFVSFGDPGDGFYKQHNYTAWSFTVGYGSPPVEGFSLFVILVISMGLGVPVVLAVSGIAYVVIRRYNQRRNPPQRFANDE